MGIIVASCGHKLKRRDPTLVATVRAQARDGKRCTSNLVLCPRCYKRAKKDCLTLDNQIEIDCWLNGLVGGKVW